MHHRLECEIREVSGETCHVLSAFTATGDWPELQHHEKYQFHQWGLGAGAAPGREGWRHCWVCSLQQSLAAVQSCLQLAGDEDLTDSRGWVALAGFVMVEGVPGRQQQSLKGSVCFHKMLWAGNWWSFRHFFKFQYQDSRWWMSCSRCSVSLPETQGKGKSEHVYGLWGGKFVCWLNRRKQENWKSLDSPFISYFSEYWWISIKKGNS